MRTPSGKPSTVYDYMKRVDAVCAHEGVTWDHLAANAITYASKYEIGGVEEEFGNRSHNSVRAAMRHFAALFG